MVIESEIERPLRTGFDTEKKKQKKNQSIYLFFFVFCFNPDVHQARHRWLFSGNMLAMFSLCAFCDICLGSVNLNMQNEADFYNIFQVLRSQ